MANTCARTSCKHLARLKDAALGTITLHGSVGEFGSLSSKERLAATAAAAEVAADRLIVAVGGDLVTALLDAHEAARHDVRFVMVHQPNQPLRATRGWIEYHRRIACAVPETGVLVYLRTQR
ncbi:beta/alpha barrel domain-containing protein [Microlunatus flavus]|uniref:hypothetical protein n=1 Tax=Microlunatus flavus TaxID=1036181 RepID=UPI000B85A2D7|nr:hypothetical protein [Microlunatus flavus]